MDTLNNDLIVLTQFKEQERIKLQDIEDLLERKYAELKLDRKYTIIFTVVREFALDAKLTRCITLYSLVNSFNGDSITF